MPPAKRQRTSVNGASTLNSAVPNINTQQPAQWESLPRDVVGVILEMAMADGAAGQMRLTCRAWWHATPFADVEEVRCSLRQQPPWPLPDTCPKQVKRLVLQFASSQPTQQLEMPQLSELRERLQGAGFERLSGCQHLKSRSLLLQLPGFVVNARDLAAALLSVPTLSSWSQLHIEAGELRLMGITGLEAWLVSACNVVDIMLRTPWTSLQHLHLKRGWPSYLIPRALQDLPCLRSLSLQLLNASNARRWNNSTLASHSSPSLGGRNGLLSFLQECTAVTSLQVRVPAGTSGWDVEACSVQELALKVAEELLLPCCQICKSIKQFTCLVEQVPCSTAPALCCETRSEQDVVITPKWAVHVIHSEAADAGLQCYTSHPASVQVRFAARPSP